MKKKPVRSLGMKSSRIGKHVSHATAGGPKAEQKRQAEERERAGATHTVKERSRFLRGTPIDPRPIDGTEKVVDLIEGTFLAYNAARLREACHLFVDKMLDKDTTVGLTMTGALTPAGLGMAAVIPLIEAGLWTGSSRPARTCTMTRISGSGCRCIAATRRRPTSCCARKASCASTTCSSITTCCCPRTRFFRQIIQGKEFQRPMSSAEFHWLCGKYIHERERVLGIGKKSLLGAAYVNGVPIYTSSPGDSSIGMNIAALTLDGNKCVIDPNADVNETASIVLGAKRTGGRSAIMILGGGSPKNFALQTEPQIQEVLGIDEKGHDYFLQITDARPDTGGLSGATPAEAVSWGKIDPDRLPDAVVCYLDGTVALPLLTSYAMAKRKPGKLRRLYDQRDKLMKSLKREYAKSKG
jgi:deoxyhypusine synthase